MPFFTRFLALLALPLLAATAALAQPGGVTIGPTQAADASAALDIVSSSKGALLPRLTADQRLGIPAPAAGLIVYQTDAPTTGVGAGTQPGFWFNAGTGAAPAWQLLADSRAVSYDPATGLTVGGGNITATTSPGGSANGNIFPFSQGAYEDVRYQVLVPASQLTAAGLTAGPLTELALTVATKSSTKPYLNLTIQLGSTTATSLAGFYTGTLTPVYTAPGAGYSTVAGTNAWPFAQPYYWDGTSSLVVQLCYDNPAGYTSGTANDQVTRYSSAANGTRAYAYTNGSAGCSLAGPSVDNAVPALRFRRGTGYALPATAGAVGQVLTQQADGSVAFASQPWTQAGTSLYPAALASSVGIGTATPAQPLEVAGSVYTNADGAGFLVDAAGLARVGLLKYGGREAGIWRVTGQRFEVGRVSKGATAITTLPDAPTTFTTDLYVSGDGKIGVGTSTPVSQLDNAGLSIMGSGGLDNGAGALTWSASQAGYVALLHNGQAASGSHGLAVKVAATDDASVALGVSAGSNTTLLRVQASGAVAVPGTLTVGTRLVTGPLTHSVQTRVAPTGVNTVTVTAALLKLTDNSSTTTGTLALNTTGVQEGQQLLITNLDPQAVSVVYGSGSTQSIAQYVTMRFAYVGGVWTSEQ